MKGRWVQAVVLGLIALFGLSQPQVVTSQVVNSSGSLVVGLESTQTTYRCAGFVTPGAAPTDVITLTGSGTKTIHVTRVGITVESTTAGIADVALIRRSSANSGGTSSAPTIAKLDTTNAAATAVCTVYTANATGLGTTVATVAAGKQSGTQGTPLDFIFGVRSTQSLVLRSATDILAVNGNGDTLLTGETWAYDLEWSEQ